MAVQARSGELPDSYRDCLFDYLGYPDLVGIENILNNGFTLWIASIFTPWDKYSAKMHKWNPVIIQRGKAGCIEIGKEYLPGQ